MGYSGGWVMGSNMIWKFCLLDIGDCILDQWRMDLLQKFGMIVGWSSVVGFVEVGDMHRRSTSPLF